MKTCFLLGLLCLAPVVAMAQHVEIEMDEGASFANFKTFRILNGTVSAKSPALNNDLVKKNIETEIRKRLVGKGLTEVEGQANLGVRYHLGAGQRTEVTAVPAGRLGLRTRRVRSKFTEGTLTVDLLGGTDRTLLWRAIVTDDASEPAKIAGNLDKMVKKALDKYPAKK